MADQVSNLRLTAKDETAAAFRSATENMKRFGDTARRAFEALAVGETMRKAYVEFAETDRKLTMLGLNAGKSGAAMKDVGEQVKAMAKANNIAVSDMIKAFDAFRERSGKTFEETLQFMPQIATAARAGGVEIAGMANVTASLIRNFNLKASDTSAALDMVVKATKRGIGDIAEVMPKLATMAAGAGYHGTEGLASILTLVTSIRGAVGGTENAVSVLERLMLKVQKDTGVVGQTSRRAAAEGKDFFASMLETMFKYNKMTDEEIAKLVGRNSDMAAALMEIRKNYPELRKTLLEFIGSSGEAARRVGEIGKDSLSSVQRLTHSITEAMEALGHALDTLGVSKGLEVLAKTLTVIAKTTDGIVENLKIIMPSLSDEERMATKRQGRTIAEAMTQGLDKLGPLPPELEEERKKLKEKWAKVQEEADKKEKSSTTFEGAWGGISGMLSGKKEAPGGATKARADQLRAILAQPSGAPGTLAFKEHVAAQRELGYLQEALKKSEEEAERNRKALEENTRMLKELGRSRLEGGAAEKMSYPLGARTSYEARTMLASLRGGGGPGGGGEGPQTAAYHPGGGGPGGGGEGPQTAAYHPGGGRPGGGGGGGSGTGPTSEDGSSPMSGGGGVKSYFGAGTTSTGKAVGGEGPTTGGGGAPSVGTGQAPNVTELQSGAGIRKGAITDQLRGILQGAGEATGIRADVQSGGQRMPGAPGATGSHRHDQGHAADLDMYDAKTGKKLSWDNPADRPRMAKFAEEASARGASGIGGPSEAYMGAGRMHVGGGTPATWHAPREIQEAWARGRQRFADAGGSKPMSADARTGAPAGAGTSGFRNPTDYPFSATSEATGLPRHAIDAVRAQLQEKESGYKYSMDNQGNRRTSNFGAYQNNMEDVERLAQYFGEKAPTKQELLSNPRLQEKYEEGYWMSRIKGAGLDKDPNFQDLRRRAAAGDKNAQDQMARVLVSQQTSTGKEALAGRPWKGDAHHGSEYWTKGLDQKLAAARAGKSGEIADRSAKGGDAMSASKSRFKETADKYSKEGAGASDRPRGDDIHDRLRTHRKAREEMERPIRTRLEHHDAPNRTPPRIKRDLGRPTNSAAHRERVRQYSDMGNA